MGGMAFLLGHRLLRLGQNDNGIQPVEDASCHGIGDRPCKRFRSFEPLGVGSPL